jgi:hypothetical protein
MADAKLVSSPSVAENGGGAPTVPSSITEETTVAMTIACGETACIEESEETPEARALAQGPYKLFHLAFFLSLT